MTFVSISASIFPRFEQFVSWGGGGGEKRLVVGKEDVYTSKISSVFKKGRSFDLTLLQSERVTTI